MDAHISCSCSKKTMFGNIIKQNKSVYIKALYGIALGFILALYVVNIAVDSMELVLVGLLGGSPSEGEPGIFETLIFVLPMLIQLCLFGTVISDDMNQSGMLLFTRMQSRKRRMAQQMLVVLSSSVLFDIFTVVSVIVISWIAGIRISDSSVFLSAISLWLFGTVLCHAAFVLIMNVCTVKFKTVPCLVGVCCVCFGFCKCDLSFRVCKRMAYGTVSVGSWHNGST